MLGRMCSMSVRAFETTGVLDPVSCHGQSAQEQLSNDETYTFHRRKISDRIPWIVEIKKSYEPSAMSKIPVFILLCLNEFARAFSPSSDLPRDLLATTTFPFHDVSFDNSGHRNSRRTFLHQATLVVPFLLTTSPSHADFTPGGTLVDYTVGVQVGNAQASPSRQPDNSNVLFAQDYYFKFGTAPPFVIDDSFPKTTPFVPVKQRYEALKKYRDRVDRGVQLLVDMARELDQENPQLLDPSAPEYSLRPMGLLANAFFASENTGTTNELFLVRWYINDIQLDIGDVGTALQRGDRATAKERYAALRQALQSYLRLMNRQINDKVGDKFVVPGS